ncbi:MAG: hypothetical protein ACOYXC_13400, partial [Candidatus Rifleibacteriota bacterium]
MKKKLIRRLRILFVVLFCLFLLFSTLVYFAYQHSFELSPTLLNRLRNLTSSEFNIDFSLDKA